MNGLETIAYEITVVFPLLQGIGKHKRTNHQSTVASTYPCDAFVDVSRVFIVNFPS